MQKLDEMDRRILALLQDNDRLPLARLSEQTGVPASTLNDRIRRLVANAIITGFHARVDPEAVGLDLLAFVFVGWTNTAVDRPFRETMAEAPEVLECHHVTGAWNYLIKVRVRNTGALERFLAETVKQVAGVERTETVIALSTSKETAALPPG